MYIVGAKTKLRAMMIAYLLHCTVPFYIVGAFAAVSIVTAVMFHSCVVCAVTARLRAMIIVYSTVRRLFFFLLVLDQDAVRQCMMRGLSFPPKPASATPHATA